MANMEERYDKPHEKRREQIRNAQRSHRARKATYLKSLEQEVTELRRLTAELADQTGVQKVIINRLHAVLASNGIAVPSDCLLPESSVRIATIDFTGQPLTKQSLRARLALASDPPNIPSGQSVSRTPSTSQSQTQDSTLKNRNEILSPPSTRDRPSEPVEIPSPSCRIRHAHAQGIDSAQVGINFVLALEQPCLLHHNVQAPLLLAKGQLGTGHEQMLSSPIMKQQPSFSLNPFHLGFPKQDQWTIPAKELEALLRFAPDLNMTGETTPVQAWQVIVGCDQFDMITFQQLERLKDILLPLVKCHGGPATEDFSGKTVVITGANTGLGLDAAKHIYFRRVDLLVLTCRDATKRENAQREILRKVPKAKGQETEVCPLDLSSHSSVLAFGDRLTKLPRLDAFIADAGIELKHWEVHEGLEAMPTVNVVSTLLTAILAYPKLVETAKMQLRPTHLTSTGSVVRIFAKYHHLNHAPKGKVFKTLNVEATANIEDRYNLSKLILLLAFRSLAQEVDSKVATDPRPVVINHIDPGWCKTDLFRSNESGFGRRLGLRLIWRSSEVGSRTLVHAITAGQESRGCYLSECRVKPESTFVRSDDCEAIQNDMWAELVHILEGTKPGIMCTVSRSPQLR